MQDEERDFIDYWNILWKRKLAILALVMLSMTSAIVVSSQMPKYYRARTVIMALGSHAGSLGAALSKLPYSAMFASVNGVPTCADKICLILKSRTTGEKVVEQFDLLKVFYEDQWDPVEKLWSDSADPPLVEDAIRKLQGITNVSTSKEGAIAIEVEWKDPKLAADIANYYISLLNDFLNKMAINVTVQVLDKAVPPERESQPNIMLNGALAGFLGLVIGVSLAFFSDYVGRMKAQHGRRAAAPIGNRA